MPARVITHSQSSEKTAVAQNAATQAATKAAIAIEKKEINGATQQEVSASLKYFVSHEDRAKFYTGTERQALQANQIERVRELQEENDHLQREISAKQNELGVAENPLAILADVEYRKTIIARNTGEILKIYSKNDERVKRLAELQALTGKLQKDLMGLQGKFIAISDMEERTKCASEFFVLKANIEKNLEEIQHLSKN